VAYSLVRKETRGFGAHEPKCSLPAHNLRHCIECNNALILNAAQFPLARCVAVLCGAGCVDCPEADGYNKLLFSDLGKQDACKLCEISFLLAPRPHAPG